MKIATKLAIAVLLFATVGAGLGSYFSGTSIRSALQNNISKSQTLETDQVMDKIDRFLYERTIDIRVITERDQLEEYLLSPNARTKENTARLLAQFDDFRVATGVWVDMSLLDTTGKVLLTSDGETEIAHLSEQNHFKDAYKSASSGKMVYTDAFLEKDSSNPIQLFMAPVRAQTSGRPVIGVVVGELAWETVLQVLVNPGDNVTAHLINKDGYILGSSDSDQDKEEILVNRVADSEIFKNAAANKFDKDESDIFPSIDTPSVKMLSTYEIERGYLGYKGNGWLLLFETPTAIAFAPSARLTRVMAISTLLVTIPTVIALMWYAYRSIIRPIRLLRSAMLQIVGGDLDGRVQVSGNDEISELGAAFNKMTEGLKDSDRRLHEEHARLTASINSLEVGFLMTDLNNEIVTINSSARTLLSDAQQTLSLDWTFDRIATLLKPSVDLPAVLKNCLDSWHVINVREVNYGKKVLHLFAGPILTHSKDDKVAVIGCVVLLEDVTDEIVQARSKDEFFSIASHELRTPLTSIRGNSSMMLEYYADTLKDPSLREMVGDIHESSTRLIEIVNDFLDVSRIEQGKIKFTFTELKLDTIIEKISYEMRAVLREKKLHLDVEPKTLDSLPAVAGDSDRVKQIIYNLIGNAVKFTESGGVKVTAVQEGPLVKVSVTDTGRGISPEGQKLLFRKFQQAGNSLFTRDTTKGTGLGLYISKLLVENMGGHIMLERSEEGKGSIFAFTLPVATPGVLAELRAAAANKGLVDSQTGLSGGNEAALPLARLMHRNQDVKSDTPTSDDASESAASGAEETHS